MDKQNTTPTPPAGQVEAVAEWKYCPECGCEEYHQGIWEKGNQEHICTGCGQSWFNDIDYSDVVRGHLAEWQALKASGAEHIAGLVQTLEGIIARPDQNDTQWKQGRKAGLAEALAYIKEALPPELRGK